MKMKFIISFLNFLLLFLSSLHAQTGCPGCVVELPDSLAEDTIFLANAPDGEAGIYYEEDVSFRMPKTTDPVAATDPNVPAGLSLDKLTILAAVNIPPGLSWEPNQVEFNLPEETDGCFKLCGTPLQPGLFEVQVIVNVEVSIVTQTSTFSFFVYIAPASSSSVGFTVLNRSGCGEVTASFENNLASNGNEGFSYLWDFGNGNSSTEENPGEQTYSEPGTYEVNYEANIDTVGFLLTTVSILNVGCGDVAVPPLFSGNPDLLIKIKDPSGDKIFDTSPINNATTPIAFNVNIPIGEGQYTLEVKDDEFLVGDENCGTVTFDKFTNDTLTDGDLVVVVQVIHPVLTINSKDTVVVFEQPEPPVLSPSEVEPLCDGQEVELLASYHENLQWFRDTNVLFGETNQMLIVSQPGSYWVEFTSADGCKVASKTVEVNFSPLPAVPVFVNENNLLVLTQPEDLPEDASLQWFLDSMPIEAATDQNYCLSEDGTYTLKVTDNASGCSNQFTFFVSFNPDVNCAVATRELSALERSLKVFPNPTTSIFTLYFELTLPTDLAFSIRDLTGKLIFHEAVQTRGHFENSMDISFLPNGVYLLQIESSNRLITRKIVKQ